MACIQVLRTSFPLAFSPCHKLSSPECFTFLGAISRVLKYTSKPWFKRGFEVILNHFVKPSDADLIRLFFQLLLLTASHGLSHGLSAPAGFSQGSTYGGTGVGSRTVPPFLQHSWCSSVCGMEESRALRRSAGTTVTASTLANLASYWKKGRLWYELCV